MNNNVINGGRLYESRSRSIRLAALRINGPLIPLIVVLALWVSANVLHHHFGHQQIMSRYESRLALARKQSLRQNLHLSAKRQYLANEERFCSRSGYALVCASLLILAVFWADRVLGKRAVGGE